jgi:hypothetical protein
MTDLISWVDKQISDREQWLENNNAILEALSVQKAMFDDRSGHNVYAVRMWADHNNGARKDITEIENFKLIKRRLETTND